MPGLLDSRGPATFNTLTCMLSQPLRKARFGDLKLRCRVRLLQVDSHLRSVVLGCQLVGQACATGDLDRGTELAWRLSRSHFARFETSSRELLILAASTFRQSCHPRRGVLWGTSHREGCFASTRRRVLLGRRPFVRQKQSSTGACLSYRSAVSWVTTLLIPWSVIACESV